MTSLKLAIPQGGFRNKLVSNVLIILMSFDGLRVTELRRKL